MFEWEQTKKSPQLHKAKTPFGNLTVASNWMKRKRIDTGHKIGVKRHKSANGPIIPYPSQGDGYKATAGYKFVGCCNVHNNRKEFYGNNLQMVKKLVENHYRQVLKLAIEQVSRA